jgi:hypothetical protein
MGALSFGMDQCCNEDSLGSFLTSIGLAGKHWDECLQSFVMNLDFFNTGGEE